MIYLSTVDMRGDLTHTMPITVFLSAFEPNLAVLCASIPMLRPCYTRFRKRRNDSKLSKSNGYDTGSGDNSKSARKNQRSGMLELDTIQMLEHDVGYKSKVEVESRNGDAHSSDGSERNLTPSPQTTRERITVEKQWTVSRT
jgi:hypothetical protein